MPVSNPEVPMDTDQAQTEPAHAPHPDTHAAAANKPKRGWKRYLIYILAVLGVLFVALTGTLAYSVWRDGQAPIPEAATIESTMTETFGRYSEEHKGWLYVTDDKRSYVMRVIQQASINDKREGDGLYFVTSGAPLDDRPGSIYGVFHLYKDAQSGALQQVASLTQSEYDQPLTPERVRFEALSKQVWAWVIKESQVVSSEAGEELSVTNVVLAPHDGAIKELARFAAQQKLTPEGGCAKAQADHAQWEKERQQAQVAAAAAAASAASGAQGDQDGEDHEEDESEYTEPQRCEDLSWTYRTDSPKDGVITPLHIVRKGISNGEAQPEKSWKVMFDPKAFVYLMPETM